MEDLWDTSFLVECVENLMLNVCSFFTCISLRIMDGGTKSGASRKLWPSSSIFNCHEVFSNLKGMQIKYLPRWLEECVVKVSLELLNMLSSLPINPAIFHSLVPTPTRALQEGYNYLQSLSMSIFFLEL